MSHSNRSSDQPRSPGQHHGDLRRALLKAAMEEIEASDGAAPSLRAVARRAGVSPGAPYHHFKGKAGLMAAVAMDGFVKLGEQQQLALSEQSEPGAQLAAMCARYVRFAVNHPRHYTIMFGQSPIDHDGDEDHELRQAALDRFIQLCKAVAAAGMLTDEAHIRQRAHLIWSLAHGAVWTISSGMTEELLLGGDDIEAIATRVARACVAIAQGP